MAWSRRHGGERGQPRQETALVDQPWQPKIVAELNDYDVKLAKAIGDFTWQYHADTDELFLVIEGRLTIRLRDCDDVVLEPGELYVAPRGMLHCPVADVETSVLLIEPRGVVNTGTSGGELTARLERI